MATKIDKLIAKLNKAGVAFDIDDARTRRLNPTALMYEVSLTSRDGYSLATSYFHCLEGKMSPDDTEVYMPNVRKLRSLKLGKL